MDSDKNTLALLVAVTIGISLGYGASADAGTLEATIGSSHIGNRYEYREFNPGAIAKYPLSPHVGLVGGVYLNSLSKVSLLAGVYGETGYGPVGAGVEAGLLTGYRTPVPVGAAPYVYIQGDTCRMTLRILPLIEDHELTGVALGLSIGITY